MRARQGKRGYERGYERGKGNGGSRKKTSFSKARGRGRGGDMHTVSHGSRAHALVNHGTEHTPRAA
jgi:hypothetical protein